ncbi:MAG TPA: alanine dehydrogenase [Gammaproteobacteria bacterium]|nr:alanine dehydrogenase [Gammaproteobacteria bacterium]
MRIGVPKEIKPLEGRVGLIPAACADLVRAGHAVFIERSAGVLAGYPDVAYTDLGVTVLADAEQLYASAELIIKVKEPIAGDLQWLRADHTLFCYLHLAASRELTERLLAIGLTAVAFETVEHNRALPLLAPMSDIAGRLAIQIGAHLLHQPQGGKGLLLGGLPASERGKVSVIGAGQAGGNAVAMAAAMGAEVTVFDTRRERLEVMHALGANVTALYPYADAVDRAVRAADLLVGAVLVPGAKAPHLVSHAQVRGMAPGSVIVDISVDQGGCIETTRPTTYADPTYSVDGVVHFCVTNMPGAVPRSAAQALSAAILPYALKLAGDADWRNDPALACGINVERGEIRHPAVRAAFEG